MLGWLALALTGVALWRLTPKAEISPPITSPEEASRLAPPVTITPILPEGEVSAIPTMPIPTPLVEGPKWVKGTHLYLPLLSVLGDEKSYFTVYDVAVINGQWHYLLHEDYSSAPMPSIWIPESYIVEGRAVTYA